MSVATAPAPANLDTGTDTFGHMLAVLNRLAAARIPYTIRHSRDDGIMAEVTVPGERWEIDFLDDGDIDIEVFRSTGGVTDDDGRIDQLIATHGE